MDTKIVLAVLISVILGGAIGFGASYIVLSSGIQSLQDELSKVKDDVHDMGSDVNSIQDDLSTIEGDVDAVNSEISGIKTDIVSLQSDLSSAYSSLTSLQNSLTSLTSTVNAMDAREWHEVYTIAGSSSTTTGTFQLQGKMLKVSWFLIGLSTDAYVEIDIRFTNGTIYFVNGSSGVWGAFDAEGPLDQAGPYYLTIYSYNASSWAVAIYDYY